MDQKKKYLFGKNICVLDLDANTTGNTNAHCIDSSMFAGDGAVQANALYQPVLTDDFFGSGIKGYVFDSKVKVFEIANYNNFKLIENDNAFTVEVKFKLNSSTSTNNLIAKGNNTNKEWAIYLSNDRFRLHIYSEGSITNYIGLWIMQAPQINTEYVLKFTYSGTKLASGITGYLNGTKYTSSIVSVGTYVKQGNFSQPLFIGNNDYYSILGGLGTVKIWGGVV